VAARGMMIAIRRERCDRQAMSGSSNIDAWVGISYLSHKRLVKAGLAVLSAGPILSAQPAFAEDASTTPSVPAVVQTGAEQASDTQIETENAAVPTPREIDFEAEKLAYDNFRDIVIARGNVVLRSADQSVRADAVEWDRKSGSIVATGNVRLVDETGNQLFTQSVELTDKFETGANNTVDFDGAVLELFGARILPLPGLAVRTDGQAIAGFLVPDLRVSESNGVEVQGSYYLRFDDNKDLLLGAHVYTEAAPMVSAEWRHLTEKGAYQITGFATYSSRISDFTGVPTSESDFRGYLFANGRFQLDPEWSVTGSLRLASDRTFLRRYDISRDDRLRSTFFKRTRCRWCAMKVRIPSAHSPERNGICAK